MTGIEPVDQAERDKAIQTLDRNVIVLAGAGTGKTKILIDRLAGLILEKETPIERIVALTFTKKAAEEMRERLETRLRNVLDEQPIDEHRAALAQKALDDIPKAQIGTIHSFCSHLLKLYPLQSNVDPKFKEDDGTGFELVFEKEWINWIAAELAENSRSKKKWFEIFKQVSLSDVRSLAVSLVSPHVDLTTLQKPLPVPFKNQAKEWLKELDALESKFTRKPRAAVFNGVLDAMRKGFELIAEGKKVEKSVQREIARKWTLPSGWEEAKADLKRLHRLAAGVSLVDDAFVNQLLDVVVPFVKRVRKELARRGLVSFDSLLVFARNLLRDYPDVRRSLKAYYATFLIDEFQDTDPLQGEILFYLAEQSQSEATHWSKVRLEPGRLFVVGDPKQSIYRFRGADIAAFEDFHNQMVDQGAETVVLSQNFRSFKSIIDFNNQVFPPLMKESRHIQPAYAPLLAAREGTACVETLYFDGEADEDLDASEHREREAQAIADWISEHVGKGFQYRDIALLFRASTAFRPYLQAFSERGIPYLAEGEKSFYKTSDVIDFFNLLAAIADPSDTLALVGVLRSPVGGLTDAEILTLKQSQSLDYRIQNPPANVESHYRMLLNFSNLAFQLPLAKLLQQILDQSWTLVLAAQTWNGNQALANLKKIVLLAVQWEEAAPLTLAAFVRRLRDYTEDQREEGENPLADVKYDAVKIMTVHKAKGLEFPVVFLPNMGASTFGSHKKPLLARDWSTGLVGLRLTSAKIINSAMVVVEEQNEKREEAEELRVFYVAMTRVKDRMILLLNKNQPNGRFSSYLKRSGMWPGECDLPVTTVKPVDVKKRWEKKKSPKITGGWKKENLIAGTEQHKQYYQSIANTPVFLSPSYIMRESEKVRSQDEEMLVAIPDPILVGQVCHKVLEQWDFKGGLNKAVDRAARLMELVSEDPASKRIIDECRMILNGFLASPAFNELNKVKIEARELPFLYSIEGKKGSSTVMRGVIDLLYRKEGKLTVLDYKTNRVDAKNLQALVEHYRPQAEIYLEAIERTLKEPVSFELLFLRTGQLVRIE